MKKELTLQILDLCYEIDAETELVVMFSFFGKMKNYINISVKGGNDLLITRCPEDTVEDLQATVNRLTAILQEHRITVAA